MKFLIYLIFTLFLAVPAKASFFGLVPPPCQMGDEYSAETHTCYYCPRGTTQVDMDCKGLPFLGRRCDHGLDHYYNSGARRCVYCERGYVLLFMNNKCHKIEKE